MILRHPVEDSCEVFVERSAKIHRCKHMKKRKRKKGGAGDIQGGRSVDAHDRGAMIEVFGEAFVERCAKVDRCKHIKHKHMR